ncbi:MAG: hypothetical protein H6Q15_40 [Bacteroidetes bacterium]|nr:hypothetical protein [Bacteroidota bacterium]
MKRYISFLFIIVFANVLFSQNTTPSIQCIKVNDDGTISITYNPITDNALTSFTEYKYESSNSLSGPFTQRGNSTIQTDNTYTYTTENANNAQVFVRVGADYVTSTGAVTNQSTAGTIYLSLILNSQTSVILNWTSPGSLLGSESSKYYIHKRLSKETTWGLIDSTDQLTYTDNFSPMCYDTVFYKIELSNINGCLSVSNLSNIMVGDNTNPIEPTVKSISVDLASQKINLSWIPSSSIDTWGYVICSGNPCVALDTVWGALQNSYICNTCDVTQLNSLAIMAFDSCWNTSLRTDSHTNIVLSYNRPSCSSEVTLTWNKYDNLPGGVRAYKVFSSQNGSPFTEYASYSASTTSTIIQVNPYIENNCFYIQAVSETGEISNSNNVCTLQSQPKEVEFNYIRSVIVSDNNNSVNLSFYVDSSLPVDGYDLYRAKGEGDFVKVGRIPYSATDEFSYSDKLPTPANKTTYSYYLNAPDECNLLYKKSNIVKTILLVVDAIDAEVNVLNWNDFSGWSCSNYDVFRVNDGISQLIGNSTSGIYGYEDNISSLVAASDRSYYYVQANEEASGPDGSIAISKSSRALVIKESLVFVPNSFMPSDNANSKFYPVCSFLRSGTYKFKVFSRAGQILFESTTINEGWDGTYKGKICNSGAYFYYLEYVNSNGEKIEKGGSVNLIH